MSALALPRRWTLRRGPRRRSIRLRLTLLYSGLFLLAGAALLAIVYVLVGNQIGDGAAAVKVGPNRVVIGKTAGPLPSGGPLVFSFRSATSVARDPRPDVPGDLTFATVQRKVQSAIGNEQATERRRLLLWSGIALALMAVASGALGWVMAGRVLDPLRTMTFRARRISDHNLHERLALDGPNDELKELADTFDDVLGRLESAFEAQRRFVANASHELRTPLTLERTMVEVALADPDASRESLRRTCRGVLAAGEQQERLIDGLLTLARSQRGLARAEQLDLREVSRQAIDAVPTNGGIRIDSDLAAARICGDARLIERLAVNLLDNAVRYNVPGGWVRIHTGSVDGVAVLRVSNSGRKIRNDEVAALLEPFRRGDGDRAAHRDGHGLGLSIVAAIAAAHEAVLTVDARPKGGLEVEVGFARASTPPLGAQDR